MNASAEDSACYVYGIVPAGTATPKGVVGLDDGELVFVEHDNVAAVVGTISVERPLGRRADLLAHGVVLDALAANGAVIPVRFGSVLADGGEVVDELLAPNVERFTEILQDLAGKSQFNLRARYDEEVVLAEVVTEDPQIAALRSQTRDAPDDQMYAERVRLGELVARAVEAKREFDEQTLMDVVAPHCVAFNVREGGGLDHLIDVAFLVDAGQRDAFEAAAEDIASAMSGRARLRLLGPLAPYDFVSEE